LKLIRISERIVSMLMIFTIGFIVGERFFRVYPEFPIVPIVPVTLLICAVLKLELLHIIKKSNGDIKCKK